MSNQVKAPQLRDKLKAMMLQELEKLPDVLAELPSKERAEVLCKLMPYVFPKVHTIGYTSGEPFEHGKW
ncbi:MAG: hypothetical protein JXQ87_09020 [Bacteroidia bacterium]